MIRKILSLSLILILLVGAAPYPQTPKKEVEVPKNLGVDLNGEPVNLGDQLGKENVYLVFWATWCPSCETEIPNLIDTHNNVEEVVLIAVNPGLNDSFGRIKRYAEIFNLPYKVAYDETGKSAQAFGIFGIPTAVLINKNGEVVYMGYPLPAGRFSKIDLDS